MGKPFFNSVPQLGSKSLMALLIKHVLTSTITSYTSISEDYFSLHFSILLHIPILPSLPQLSGHYSFVHLPDIASS